MNVNSLEFSQIERLTPEQLTRLLQMLLHLEVIKYELTGFSYVSQKLNVTDGGEDGYIKVADIGKSNWLTHLETIFQCKATDLSPTNCKKELLQLNKEKPPRNELKAVIKKVLDNGGCYILFMSHHAGARTKLKSRYDNFYEAFDDVGLKYKKNQVIIYDALKISQWAMEFPSTLYYVLECNGITKPEIFRTWSQWKLDIADSLKYPFQDSELKEKTNLFKKFLKEKSVLRVLGHSGIGKTRFVFEALKEDKLDAEQNKINFSVVYYDLGLVSSEGLNRFIVNNKNSTTAIIVIDNCPEDTHNVVAGLVKSNSKIKIITIDYAVTTEEPNFISLTKEEQSETVLLMLKALYPGFLDQEIIKIAELAEGYPKMVELFDNSIAKNRLDFFNTELPKAFVKRLVFGRGEHSDEEFNIIKSCAIFSDFDFVDDEAEETLDTEQIKKLEEQYRFIAKYICKPSVDPDIFYRVCRKFKKERKILERRGYKYIVVPTPLALNLAVDWLLDCSPGIYEELCLNLTNSGMIAAFCKRLQSLDQIEKAKSLVGKLWGIGGPFMSAEVLNTELGSRLFRSVVEVNPPVTLDGLENTFIGFSTELLSEFGLGRRNIIWALEKLVFRKETFFKAGILLSKFAVAENEEISNNATGQFLNLFHIFLPGTEASLNQRLELIDWVFNQKNNSYDRLAIKALNHCLKGESFGRSGGAERQGSSQALVDYKPKDWNEIFDYWNKAIIKLGDIALSSNQELAELAEEMISNNIRSLFSHKQIDLINNILKKIIKRKNGSWDAGLKSLIDTKRFESNHLQPKEIHIVETLIEQLQPVDIISKLKSFVSSPIVEYEFDREYKNHTDVGKANSQKVANELIKSNSDYSKYFPLVLIGEQRQGFSFGERLAELITDHKSLLFDLADKLKSINKNQQNSIVIGGVLSKVSVEIKSAFLEFLIQDEELYWHGFNLSRISTPTLNDILKLFKLVDKQKLKIEDFESFQYGRVLDHLGSEGVLILCSKIEKYKQKGQIISIKLLAQYVHINEEKWLFCKAHIRKLILRNNFFTTEAIYQLNLYLITYSAEKLLNEQKKDSTLAKKLSRHIYESSSKQRFYAADSYISNLCELLVKRYFSIFWKEINAGILSNGREYLNLKFLLGSSNGTHGYSGVLFSGNLKSYKTLIAWALLTNDKGPKRLAYMMPISISDNGMETWHPFAKEIINKFGENQSVLNEINANIGSYSSINDSAIEYFTTVIKLFTELENHPLKQVKDWAKKAINYYRLEQKRKKLEMEQDRLR